MTHPHAGGGACPSTDAIAGVYQLVDEPTPRRNLLARRNPVGAVGRQPRLGFGRAQPDGAACAIGRCRWAGRNREAGERGNVTFRGADGPGMDLKSDGNGRSGHGLHGGYVHRSGVRPWHARRSRSYWKARALLLPCLAGAHISPPRAPRVPAGTGHADSRKPPAAVPKVPTFPHGGSIQCWDFVTFGPMPSLPGHIRMGTAGNSSPERSNR